MAALAHDALATHTLATSIRPVGRGVNRSGLILRVSLTASAGALILAALAGCSGSSAPTGPVIDTTDQLIAALQQAGRQIEETAMLAVLGELVGGQVFFLDGSRLDVFEYESAEARQAAAESLTNGGAAAAASDEPFVAWGRGRIIVVYRGSEGGAIALLSGLLGDPLTLPHDAVDEPYPPAVSAAIAFLAQSLGDDPGRIVVVKYEAAEWPDACLGLGRPSEACAEVVMAGWRIVLRLDQTTYTLRSDSYGELVRRE